MSRSSLAGSVVALSLVLARAGVASADPPPPFLSADPPPSEPAAPVSAPSPSEPAAPVSAPPPSEPAAPVSAPSPAEPARDEGPRPEGLPRHDLVRVNLGLRVGYLPGRGFDAFSTDDVLPQWSIDATYPVLTRRRLVVGVGLGWDFGGSSATFRGLDASLRIHRLYAPIEGRYYLAPALAVFGKIAPGAAVALASVQDPSAPSELSASGWAFSADASAGASILLGPRARYDRRQPRVWLTPEIGYAFTTKASLRLNPDRDAEGVLGHDEDASLRSLALSGFFWRASVGMTF
jgi:hypothetical protein